VKSKKFHRDGNKPNKAQVLFQVKEKWKKMVDDAIISLTEAMTRNSRMLMHMVALVEILKEKGIITSEDVDQKLKDLQEAREAKAKAELEAERKIIADESLGRTEGGEAKPDDDAENPEGGDVQPEETGDNESSS
jgi:hypothetical protein